MLLNRDLFCLTTVCSNGLLLNTVESRTRMKSKRYQSGTLPYALLGYTQKCISLAENSWREDERVLGIDLGTTYSVTAILEGGKPVVIPNLEGDKTTPSVVAIGKKGNAIIGRNAKRQAVVNPLNTYFSIKRYMGKRNSDLLDSAEEARWAEEGEPAILSKEYTARAFKLVGEDIIGMFNLEYLFDFSNEINFLNSSVLLHSPILGEGLRPEFIAAKLLKKLALDASVYIKENLKKVVITVPAYFDDLQRKATTAAGEIAGLEVVKIINEPSSAAFAYGFDKVLDEKLLVFDLGGGTFDVSVLEVNDRIFEVLSTGGDSALGGDDFDQVIGSYTLKEFYKHGGQDLSFQLNAMQRILEASELAKIRLSASNSTIVNLPFLCSARKDILNDLTSIRLKITRELFEDLSKDLVQRCLGSVKLVLNDAQLSVQDLSKNILVGGSTRMPCIKNLLFSYLGKAASDFINPDEVVALGAALQGGLISGEIENLVLLDVLALSLGVEVNGRLMQNVVPRNTVIPVSRTQTFSTSVDNQPSVHIHVLQGERPICNDNRSLGIFDLSVQKAPAGIPKINITFDISSDGVLSVTGVDSETNEAQDISVSLDTSLTAEQIAALVAKAEENSSRDEKRVNLALLEVKVTDMKSTMNILSMSLKKKLIHAGLNSELIKLFYQRIYQLENQLNKQSEEEAQSTSTEDSFFIAFQQLAEDILKWEKVLFIAKEKLNSLGNNKSKRGDTSFKNFF